MDAMKNMAFWKTSKGPVDSGWSKSFSQNVPSCFGIKINFLQGINEMNEGPTPYT